MTNEERKEDCKIETERELREEMWGKEARENHRRRSLRGSGTPDGIDGFLPAAWVFQRSDWKPAL